MPVSTDQKVPLDRDHALVVIEDILLGRSPVPHPFGAYDAVEVADLILDALGWEEINAGD